MNNIPTDSDGEARDIRSCGNIMHLLLFGTVPSVEETKDSLTSPQHVDATAGDLVRALLGQRVGAEAALNHPWVLLLGQCSGGDEPDFEEVRRNLKVFKAQNDMQKAVLAYLASQRTDQETERKVREVFAALDRSGDGTITAAELTAGYQKLYRNKARAKQDAAMILKKVGLGFGCGAIDYSGEEYA